VNTTTLREARATIGADNVSATGQGVDIAVIETGANVNNGRLFGNGTDGSDIRVLNSSKNFVTNETVADQGYDAIEDGSSSLHGTWTASAIAGNASGTAYDGVAPNAELLVLKALADDGSGSTADIAEAVRYAADQDVDVISMSLGSPLANAELREAIDYAYDEGVQAVVVAVGNSRPQRGANIAAPAHYGPTIAVAATTANDSARDVRSAYFSQAGPDPGTADDSDLASAGAMPDVAAPGHQVEATVVTTSGTVRESALSGTSMATPVVSGGVGAALEANSTLAGGDHEAVVDAVAETARPAPVLAPAEVGHGVFAVDNTIQGTTPADEQTDILTTAAEQRQLFYEGHSDAQGGWLASLFD